MSDNLIFTYAQNTQAHRLDFPVIYVQAWVIIYAKILNLEYSIEYISVMYFFYNQRGFSSISETFFHVQQCVP